jgi:hypothetical protein
MSPNCALRAQYDCDMQSFTTVHNEVAPHPKGTQARILLSSVFGPYAQDDQFGSRSINPMELYHNQVTRAQGSFSLRMFHRSWGIMLIQQNISAPCTVLDAFKRELTENSYDIVGISSIISNVAKVREMCRLVRKLSPQSTIIIGGHVAAIPGISYMIDADHIVRGEGISWMRRYLGEDPEAPIVHPQSFPASVCAPWVFGFQNAKEQRPQPSSRLLAVPSAATSAQPHRSLEEKASSSTSTTQETNCST